MIIGQCLDADLLFTGSAAADRATASGGLAQKLGIRKAAGGKGNGKGGKGGRGRGRYVPPSDSEDDEEESALNQWVRSRGAMGFWVIDWRLTIGEWVAEKVATG